MNSFLTFILLSACAVCQAELIEHSINLPDGPPPYPVVIALHSSGGFQTIKKQIKKYTKEGYMVVAPNFFKRHSLNHRNRFETWTTYREPIEAELIDLISAIQKDPNVDSKNIFAVGFSNGGYWASFLAAKQYVNAGVSHYGVWSFPKHNGNPADYFDEKSHPVLALHGAQETVQRLKFVEPEIRRAQMKSQQLQFHLFKEVGHSWDCKPCKEDGYNQHVSDESLRMTLEFFKNNKK